MNLIFVEKLFTTITIVFGIFIVPFCLYSIISIIKEILKIDRETALEQVKNKLPSIELPSDNLQLKILLCSKIIIRDLKNQLSIIGLIDYINFPIFPFIMPEFSILCIWKRKSISLDNTFGFDLKMELNSKTFVEEGLHGDFKNKYLSRTIMNLETLPIEEPGLLKVTIYDKKQNHIYGEYEMTIGLLEKTD